MRYQNQRGQSMVFGLLFMGIAVIALILIFNQGILTRDRVQLENAADAAVYSQAKLFARHQNLIAYTNRAMIANELSIGQVVALMSWAKRYSEIPSFVNTFPAYQVPILLIPPKPSIADVLSTVTLPYQWLGYGIRGAATPMMSIYPGVVSSFNTIMGFFQKAFALATIEAQFRIPGAVVAQHQMERPQGRPEDNLEVAPLSNLFLVQNFILTYFADYIPIDILLEQITGAQAADPGAGAGAGANPPPVVDANNDPEEPSNMLADFLGGYTPGSMLVNMSTDMHSKTAPGAKDSLERRQASRYFAATINDQRNTWLADRRFDPSTSPLAGISLTTPKVTLPLGFINISFRLGLEVGVFNNGGTAYAYNPMSVSNAGKAMPVFGWRSIDFSSIGFKLKVELTIEVCLPVVGCAVIFDNGINFGLGLPLGGATYQFVTNRGDELLFAPQWGTPAQGLLDSASRPYGEAMHPVHAVTYGWGMVPPLFIYGARPGDVSYDASGSPSFFTLGSDHAETGRSKEFTVAVSKPHNSVRTSDNPEGLNLQSQGRNIDNRERQIVRPDMFALQTQEVRAEDNPLLFLWGDGERMMTISSAETYFAPPPGREESPNQYSPFWDARLREPSKVVQFIASGQIDIREVLGLNNLSAAGVAGFLLGLANDNLLEPGLDIALDKLPPMIKPIAGPIIKEVAGSVLDRVTEGVVGALE